MATVDQKTLFNVNTKAINPYWIDPNQPLQVPQNPLHFEAHKLQLLLERLFQQSETNPAQFNSTNYIKTLDRFTTLCQAINDGKTINEVLDAERMAENGNGSTAPDMGETAPVALDPGISADNPFAR